MNKQSFNENELTEMNPREFRDIVRQGKYVGSTHMACRGYVQANLVVIPEEMALEFLLFCQRNPRACAVLDATDPGDPHPKLAAPEADLRTDLPKYRIFKYGKIIDEPTDITAYWRDDLVAVLIGGSYSFDWSLRAANVQFRLTGGYTTNIQCVPAGRFYGPMVVTTRLFKTSYDAVRAVQISSRHPEGHGPPVHIGDPAAIGIKDLCHPDIFSISESIAPQQPDEIALHWGCGITPQTVALQSKVPFMITHVPSHVFITDMLAEEVASI